MKFQIFVEESSSFVTLFNGLPVLRWNVRDILDFSLLILSGFGLNLKEDDSAQKFHNFKKYDNCNPCPEVKDASQFRAEVSNTNLCLFLGEHVPDREMRTFRNIMWKENKIKICFSMRENILKD